MDAPQPPQQPGPWGEPSQWPAAGQPAGAGAEQPQSLSLAVRLMQVGAALSVVSVLFTFVQRDEIRDIMEDDNPDFTADEIDTAVNLALGVSVVAALLGAALWLWMANSNGKGKTWARTTATVLGGINVLFTLINIATGQTTALGVLFALISLALAVTILVLLYRPDSNRYYDVMSGRTGY
ncbi:MAG TPA: hypothetical protein VK611_26210 [Acidimicrobiales bacterium]|nr:hypothetical protein [Acidimicrobiales bacterium]